MPKVAPLINDFSAGEFGPLASARTDLERYPKSLELCQDYVPTQQGGATKRPGTKYVDNCKSNSVKARLEGFVLADDQVYVLEFGETFIRFYKNRSRILAGGGGAYEVVTPYSADEVFQLTFCQSNQYIYIFHPSHAPRKLQRFADANWSIGEFLGFSGPFLSYPYANYSQALKNSHAPNTNAGSGAVTVTFINGTSTRAISNALAHTTGEIKIQLTAITTQRYVNGDKVRIQNVGGTVEANGVWPVEDLGNGWIVLKGSTFANAYSAGADTCDFAPFVATDVGRRMKIYGDNGWTTIKITGFTNESTITGEIEDNTFSTVPGTWGTAWELGVYSDTTGYPAAGCFHDDRLTMVGPKQYFTGSRPGDYDNFLQKDNDNTVTASHAYLFGLNSKKVSECRWVESDEKGLLIGTGSAEWIVRSASASEVLSPLSVSAKEATSLGSKNVYPVKVGKAVLFPQPAGKILRELNYFFDVDGFHADNLTKLAHHITESGIVQMAFQSEPHNIVWCVRNDGKLAALTYERGREGFKAAWHRHQIGGVSNTASTNAVVESLTCVPSVDSDYDEVWLAVRRRINGATVRYIEYITKFFEEDDDATDAFFVDCGKTYDDPKTITGITNANPGVVSSVGHGFSNGDEILLSDLLGMSELQNKRVIAASVAADTYALKDENGDDIDTTEYEAYVSGGYGRKMVSSISGAGHLEGQTVDILGDGALIEPATVTAGVITLANKCAKVHYGLNYKAKLKLPRLDAGSADGTAIGKTKRTHKIGIMLDRSRDLKFGMNFNEMNEVQFNDQGDLGHAPELFTGIKIEELDADYDTENQLCLMSDKPLPSTILAIMPRLHTQDG